MPPSDGLGRREKQLGAEAPSKNELSRIWLGVDHLLIVDVYLCVPANFSPNSTTVRTVIARLSPLSPTVDHLTTFNRAHCPMPIVTLSTLILVRIGLVLPLITPDLLYKFFRESECIIHPYLYGSLWINCEMICNSLFVTVKDIFSLNKFIVFT